MGSDAFKLYEAYNKFLIPEQMIFNFPSHLWQNGQFLSEAMKTKFPATVMVFGMVLISNVNDFKTKRSEPLILAIFFISKRNEPCLFQNF